MLKRRLGAALRASSLERRFGLVTGALAGILLAGSGWLFLHQWAAYADAERALANLRIFRAVLLAMEKVSAERGPGNAALGEDLPIPSARLATLQAFRGESDARIADLLGELAAADCTPCRAERAAVLVAQADLVRARATIDSLLRQPRARRSSASLYHAIDGMVRVIPRFVSIADAAAASVDEGAPGILGRLLAARLAAVLREQAGLLGSQLAPALAAHRPLGEAEQYAIERTRGTIDQLRGLLQPRVLNDPALAHGTFQRMESQYFDEGLAYIEQLRVLASAPAGTGVTTAELTQHYVPLMASIVAFRDEILDLAQAQVQRWRDTRLAWLAAIGAALSAVIATFFLSARLFRRQVVQPFAEATRDIRAIAAGQFTAVAPAQHYSGEIRELFEAVQVLQEHSSERARLEQERHRLIEELTVQAERDALTGLLNRGAFERQAAPACAQAGRAGRMLALTLFDVDYFKRINDTYGHAAGDRVLVRIARLCREVWQADEIVARVGGEEFAVLAFVPGRREAVAQAQALRERLGHAGMQADNGEGIAIRASFGLAFAAAGEAAWLEDLMKRADRQLYRAKDAGRDGIAVEDEPGAGTAGSVPVA